MIVVELDVSNNLIELNLSCNGAQWRTMCLGRKSERQRKETGNRFLSKSFLPRIASFATCIFVLPVDSTCAGRSAGMRMLYVGVTRYLSLTASMEMYTAVV